MGSSKLDIPTIKPGDWVSVRQATQKLALKLGPTAEPTFAGISLTGFTANKLVATDATKKLVSTDLYSWVTQTANQILIADDGDGTITFSLPQSIHTSAVVTFGNITATTKFRVDTNGTPSVPVYTWSNDTNTGLYHSVADTLDFATGGAQRLSIANAAITLYTALVGGAQIISGTAFDINGGTIDNAIIGGATPANAGFIDVTADTFFAALGTVDALTYSFADEPVKGFYADHDSLFVVNYGITRFEFGKIQNISYKNLGLAGNNLTTTGLITAGKLDVDSLTFDANTITDSSGAISFDNENLLTTGTLGCGILTASNYTAANLLTACATNAGALDFSAASKTLTVEDNAVVSQDYSSDGTPTFGACTLGSGTTIGNLTLADGSITDSSGTIDTGILTPGNLALTDYWPYGAAIFCGRDGTNTTAETALVFVCRNPSTAAGYYVMGAYGWAIAHYNQNVTGLLAGVAGIAQSGNGAQDAPFAGSIAQAIGLYGILQLCQGTASVASCVKASMAITSAGTVTNAFYYYADATNLGSATITNLYGLYLPAITQGGTSNWAIYSNDGNSFFGGTGGIAFGDVDRNERISSAAHGFLDLDATTNIRLNQKVDFNVAMGNSAKDPTTDAPADWVECKIQGTTYYLPAYAAS